MKSFSLLAIYFVIIINLVLNHNQDSLTEEGVAVSETSVAAVKSISEELCRSSLC